MLPIHPRTWLLCVLLAAPAVHAECAARTDHSIPKGQWFLHWENDLFTRFASDEYFTNGVRVGYAWEPGCERAWARRPALWLEASWLGRRLGIDDASTYLRSATVATGQSIYTPSNITIPDYLPDDHPYGGYLYGLLRYDYTSALSDDTDGWRSQTQKSLELQMGVVGPAAGGAEVQKWVHEVMDDKDPKGWEHQLRNEPAVLGSFLWQKRFARPSRRFDLIPSMGVAVGNVQTHALVGITMRVGENISGFPSRSVEAARVTRDELRDDHGTCFGMHFFSQCYLFLSGEVRYVAHNIFLDGNTGRDGGPRVDRVPVVLDLVAGLRLRIPQWGLTFTYTGVRRTREFEPVPATSRHPDGRHVFGVASFSWDTHF